jgi:lipopolysaccharide exporter
MVTRSLGLVSFIVLARVLDARDFGLVAMATTFSATILAFSEVGLQDALVRAADTGRDLYDTAFTMQILRGLLTSAVIAAGAPLVADWFHEPRLLPILLLLAALNGAVAFENIGIVEFRRDMRFSMEFALLFLPRISQFAVTVIAALTLHSYWALVIGMAVAQLLRLAMTYLVHPYRGRLTLSRWSDLVGFSFWTWASSLATAAWERSDAFILGPILGAAQLGIYLLAAELAVLPLSELVAPASRALFSGVSAAEHRGTDTVGLALPVIAALLTAVVPMTIAISAASGPIVMVLMGARWTAAQPLIAVLAWMCVFSPFSWVCATVLTSRGQVRRTFQAVAVAAAVKIGVIYVSARTGNLQVVAVAAVLCVGIEALLYLDQLRRGGDPRWRNAGGGFYRVILAGAGATLALRVTGIGWRGAAGVGSAAIVHGAMIGSFAVAACVGVQLTLWSLAGRPAGPESRLLEIAMTLLRRPGWPRSRPAPPVLS